jgi:hypothetical protein
MKPGQRRISAGALLLLGTSIVGLASAQDAPPAPDPIDTEPAGEAPAAEAAPAAAEPAAPADAPTGATPAPSGAAAGTPPTPQDGNSVDLEAGELRYGLTGSILRFSATRPDNEPARTRNYSPALDVIPPEIGFQFTYRPKTRPWLQNRLSNGRFQLMSAGGILLLRLGDMEKRQGGLGLAATLSFFEESLGLGVGVDLYRGIPTLGTNGVAGDGTAYTGLLAWAFVKEGEVTPENAFVLVSFNLSGLVGAFTQKVK